LRLMAPSQGRRCGRSGGDLPGRRRSSGAPWNRRPRRRDARKTRKRLESLPAPRRKPSWCTRCASKCFTFPPRDIPWSSQTAAGTRLDAGWPGKSVKEAIRAVFFRTVLIPSELPLRHPRQARPASDRSPVAQYVAKFLHVEALRARCRVHLRPLCRRNEPDNSCATPSNYSRPYHSATAHL
jgi:hypothetical protein